METFTKRRFNASLHLALVHLSTCFSMARGADMDELAAELDELCQRVNHHWIRDENGEPL